MLVACPPVMSSQSEMQSPPFGCAHESQRSFCEPPHLSRAFGWGPSERCASQILFDAPLPSDCIDAVRTSFRAFLGPKQTPMRFGSTTRSDPNRSLCGKPHPSRAARSRTCGHIARAAPAFEPAYPHTRSTALAAFFPCATQASPFVTSVQPATTGIASFKPHPLPFKRAAPWMTHRMPHPCWRWSIRTHFGR